MQVKPKEEIVKEEWVYTSCRKCYAGCAARVLKVNGIPVKVEGNPNDPQSEGKLCVKGYSGIMDLWDPNRLNVPLKRTNPKKGYGVDPKWVEISWEEAIDTIVEKWGKVAREAPHRLASSGTTIQQIVVLGMALTGRLGGRCNVPSGGGFHCGNGAHTLDGWIHGSWDICPDLRYTNYVLYFGASHGHAAGHGALALTIDAAEARARGAKFVVFDPLCGFAGSKATEWVPIRPGTDAAVALAMINILLNDLGIYDANYLKKHTNGPYLIKADGLYLRDSASKKPLVWDGEEKMAKTFDDPSVKDFAIEGSYEIDGVECKPAFQLLKEHVTKYTPEMASEISSVPEETIRRIAAEFGKAARIGSTIVIDGKELPYRPVAVTYFRGAQGHKNSLQTCAAILLLTQIVGAADVPGGTLGFCPVSYGHPETGRPRYEPIADADGLMVQPGWMLDHKPYPLDEPERPKTPGLDELFPMAMFTQLWLNSDRKELQRKFGIDGKLEAMCNFGSDPIRSFGSSIAMETFKEIPFIFSANIFENEFNDTVCDIVLPDVCHLERLNAFSSWPWILSFRPGLGHWMWGIEQPVVEPIGQRRPWPDVLLEIVYKTGGDLPAVYHDFLNRIYGMQELTEPYRLKPDERVTWEEYCDRVLKCNFGEERGLDWFKENGVISWPKRVEEVYWRPFLNVRVPIYFEFLKGVAEKMKEITDSAGLHIDYRYYSPLAEWLPCPHHEERSEEYDMAAFYYRDVLVTQSTTQENPYLDEACQINPYSFNICINSETARKKGIKDGDEIVLESAKGRKISGPVRLTELIHPEGLAVASGLGGHWTKGQPIALGKGIFFNELIELDLEHYDPASLSMDITVQVKVYKKER